MSSLLRYPPGPEAGARSYPVWVPVDTYMDKEGYKELEAHGLRVGILSDTPWLVLLCLRCAWAPQTWKVTGVKQDTKWRAGAVCWQRAVDCVFLAFAAWAVCFEPCFQSLYLNGPLCLVALPRVEPRVLGLMRSGEGLGLSYGPTCAAEAIQTVQTVKYLKGHPQTSLLDYCLRALAPGADLWVWCIWRCRKHLWVWCIAQGGAGDHSLGGAGSRSLRRLWQ